jgi:phosphonate transport system substrate-binding protein
VAERAGRRPEIVQKRTYEETNRLLLGGEIDVAFICTGAYVAIRDRVRLLAVPVVNGSPTYASVVLARRSGPASIDALRGLRFAFTDPLSNTGWLYPIYLLKRRFSTAPREFFATIVYSGAHDESIRLLLTGAVDAAAVDSLVWEEFVRRQPTRSAELGVIHRSPVFGAPPFVANRALDAALADTIRAVLLGMAEDAEGAAILSGLGVQDFVREADYAFAIEVADVALEGSDGPLPGGAAGAEAP